MSRLNIIVLVFAAFFLFAGCTSTQGGKNTWRGFSTFYNKHVNKPAKLDFDDSVPLKNYEISLIQAISDLDFELGELLRIMDDSDRSPDEEWSQALLERFPWLGGAFLADGQGRIVSQLSDDYQKIYDFSVLLEPDPKQRPADLRAAILQGDSGPLVYLAKPVYLKSDLRVIVTCWFDMHSLLKQYGEPDKFVMLSGEHVLWPGVFNFSETPLADIDWHAAGLKSIDGKVKNENGEFYWLSSFFANIQFVYAVPVKGDFTLDLSQLEQLQ